KGLELITVPSQRTSPHSLSPRLKSLNYLSNIMAKIEAINSGVSEAIMLNSQGQVAECTGDNIFIFRRGRLITPPTYIGALEGITRNVVIGLSKKLGIEVAEEIFSRHDVYNAEECFLTGTAAEVIPVVKVDKRIIGSGKPGKVTKRLSREFRKLTRREGTAIYK
ncbi:aminotransferase class IV, partial [bacterium]|nr:aminotransferase class IV [bacterium]